ncbi:MAG: Sulfate transport system permease protein CysW [Firmicutes bacterium]|nr:Sulfate transport system permease protein CysW [Bacillota bacterium]
MSAKQPNAAIGCMRRTELRPACLTESANVRLFLITSAVLFLALILFLPLVLVFAQAFQHGGRAYLAAIANPYTLSAARLTILAAAVAVPLNTLFGVALAWAVTKHNFIGKNLLVSLIDLPFAVSTVIAGMMFVLLFSPNFGLLFGPELFARDIRIIFALPGMILATVFVTIPFVARGLIPVMQAQGNQEEEAAVSLGANWWQLFWRVTFPKIKWGLFYSVILSSARAVGEFGATSVVSGRIRGVTNTLPLHVEDLYNEFQFVAAFAVSSLLVLVALLTLLAQYLMGRKQTLMQSEEGS